MHEIVNSNPNLRKLIGCLGTVLLAAGVVAASPPETAEARTKTVPACFREDQRFGPCFWDASKRGNGHGVDFYLSASGKRTYYRQV